MQNMAEMSVSRRKWVAEVLWGKVYRRMSELGLPIYIGSRSAEIKDSSPLEANWAVFSEQYFCQDPLLRSNKIVDTLVVHALNDAD